MLPYFARSMNLFSSFRVFIDLFEDFKWKGCISGWIIYGNILRPALVGGFYSLLFFLVFCFKHS